MLGGASSMNLIDFGADVYSQNGEDGVIAELLRRLGMTDGRERWCVEFGAWDGKFLSNTFNLVNASRWNAVYIEGDPDRFRDLEETARQFPAITPVLSMVGGMKGEGSALDDVLSTTSIPTEYDLLSIDIDSSDLDVWARHIDFRPSIVVIEINSGIEPGILQWHSPGAQGNSFSSTVRVATAKGYTLVCHTGNLIFVTNELSDLVGLDSLDVLYPERLFSWRGVHRTPQVPITTRIRRHLPETVKRPLKKIVVR